VEIVENAARLSGSRWCCIVMWENPGRRTWMDAAFAVLGVVGGWMGWRDGGVLGSWVEWKVRLRQTKDDKRQTTAATVFTPCPGLRLLLLLLLLLAGIFKNFLLYFPPTQGTKVFDRSQMFSKSNSFYACFNKYYDPSLGIL